jgi:protease-4
VRKGWVAGLIVVAGLTLGGLFLVTLAVAMSSAGGRHVPTFGPSIAVVEIQGEIKDALDTVERLHDLEEDDSVKAVVVRIDSPGGAVGPSQELHREIQRLDARKPVVASLGAVAASGGYYAAVAARKIVASPGTITASIGVISHLPNVAELAQKIGFRLEVVESGPAKDVGNPFRAMNDTDRQVFQNLVDGAYGQFVKAVADGRKLPEEQVRTVADGRVLTGEQARDAGLVDELGNFRDAVALAAKLGGIRGDPKLSWPPEDHGSLLVRLLSGVTQGAMHAATEELRLQASPIAYRLPGF